MTDKKQAEPKTIAIAEPSRLLNIAAYKFVTLEDLLTRRRQVWNAAAQNQLRGTVLLSPEGINLFLAGSEDGIEGFLDFLADDPSVGGLTIKRSWTDFQPFRRLLVKVKKEIIAFGVDSVQPAKATSPKLTPEELKRWLDEGRELTLLDTRNDYEVGLGTFRNAIDLGIHQFRNFPEATRSLPEELKHKPIVMFCTGGIRCEKAGPFMEQAGFTNVYQLDGGILNYFERCGQAHYDGDCFVFDHRVAVTPTLEPSGARLCFACQAVLSADDIASEKYVPEVSCPHCYTTPEEQTKKSIARRHEKIRHLAENLPGCEPYENRQPMFVARKYSGWKPINWLSAAFPIRTKEEWQALVQSKQIVTGSHHLTANEPVDPETAICEGQVFVLVRSDYVEPIVDANIEIVYEDRWLVVVNKPTNLPVHASGRYFRNTLEHILGQVYYPDKLFLGHRLDAATSGLVALTRRNQIANRLQSQFADERVSKTYIAKVVGHPEWDQFECDLPISDEPVSGGARWVDADGQQAKTRFRILERCDNGTSLVEAIPFTGRTHQIRIHLAHSNFPIVGDALYGRAHLHPNRSLSVTSSADGISSLPVISQAHFASPTSSWETSGAARNSGSPPASLGPRPPLLQTIEVNASHDKDVGGICLHAWRLVFDHPVTGDRISFEAKLPSWVADKSRIHFA